MSIRLQVLVRRIREDSPNIGEAIGQLHSMGYHVPRNRVCDAIRITDPINTALRWRGILTARQPYSVASPNSLWHIGVCVCVCVCLSVCVCVCVHSAMDSTSFWYK